MNHCNRDKDCSTEWLRVNTVTVAWEDRRRHANVEMMSLGRNSVVDLPASNLVALCALLSVRTLCQGQPAEIK